MKNIKYLFCALALVLLSSCENDGGTSEITLIESAVPNITKVIDTDPILDLNKLVGGEDITLIFTSEVAQGNPAQTNIVGSYKKLNGDVYTSTLFNDIGNLKQEFSLTPADIVAAFSELNSTSDIELGDVLSITTSHILDNGTVLNILNDDGSFGVGANIQTTSLFNIVITYPVSCPTMLEGNYTSVVTQSTNPNLRSPQPVTITQPSAGTYILSDGTADIFGPDFPIGLTFTDVCNTLSVATSSVQFPGQVDFNDLGATLDTDTGIITLVLEYTPTSCCGLAGQKYTLQLTPAP